jgi:hypothetical protein
LDELSVHAADIASSTAGAKGKAQLSHSLSRGIEVALAIAKVTGQLCLREHLLLGMLLGASGPTGRHNAAAAIVGRGSHGKSAEQICTELQVRTLSTTPYHEHGVC